MIVAAVPLRGQRPTGSVQTKQTKHMEIHKSHLAAKVAAINRLNRFINEARPVLASALAPFIGKKIHLASGCLAEKCKTALQTAIAPLLLKDCRAYFRSSVYSLYMRCDCWEHYQNTTRPEDVCACYTPEYSLCLAEISCQTLEKIHTEPVNRPTDWSAAKVIGLRKDYEAADKAMREYESALGGFGLYDR